MRAKTATSFMVKMPWRSQTNEELIANQEVREHTKLCIAEAHGRAALEVPTHGDDVHEGLQLWREKDRLVKVAMSFRKPVMSSTPRSSALRRS